MKKPNTKKVLPLKTQTQMMKNYISFIGRGAMKSLIKIKISLIRISYSIY